MPPARGKKGSEAERLVQLWLEREGWMVHRAAATGLVKLPNGRTICKSHDLFGCLDLLAIRCDMDATWGLQVTTQKGRSARRRKIEGVTAWPSTWRIYLASHEVVPDPAKRSRRIHYVKLELYNQAEKKWLEPTTIQIDVKEIEAWRKKRDGKRIEGRVAGA